MSETSNRKALIEQLLSDRDAEFRRAVKAGRQLKELSDVKRMQADYEAGPAEKDKAIQERDRALGSKENQIAQLEQKLLYLERKMWGAMSEKRRIPDDPNQLKLDFDLPEMTPEEEETVRKAVEEVTECRKVSVKEHENGFRSVRNFRTTSAAWKNISILTVIRVMKTNGSCSRIPKRPNTWNSSLPNCTSG